MGNGTPDEDYTSKWLGESERTESHKQTCQVSRNFRESPEIGRDLQVSRNRKENSRNRGILLKKKNCERNAFCCRI